MDDNPYRSPLQTAASADARDAGLFAFLGRVFVSLFRLWRIVLGMSSGLMGLGFIVMGIWSAPGLEVKVVSALVGLALTGAGYFVASRAMHSFRRDREDAAQENSQIPPNNHPPDAF